MPCDGLHEPEEEWPLLTTYYLPLTNYLLLATDYLLLPTCTSQRRSDARQSHVQHGAASWTDLVGVRARVRARVRVEVEIEVG